MPHSLPHSVPLYYLYFLTTPQQFLDFAVERLLLRKVDTAGYCFVHPLLLDYFASLETE